MVKVLLSVCAIIALSGCGDNLFQTIDNSTDSHDDNSIYVDENGSYSVQYDNSTYTQDGSGTDAKGKPTDPYFGDIPYREDMTQSECTEAGYFFCTIQMKCLNQPLQGSTCSAR